MTKEPDGVVALDVDAPVIPSGYVRRWVEFLAARGVAPERVLEHTYLTVDALADSALSISQRMTAQVCFNGLTLTGDPAIGLEFGLSLQPTAHGWVGIAAVAATTARAALDVVARFGILRSGPWHFRWVDHGGRVEFRLEERIPMGPLRPLLFEMVLGGFCRFVELARAPGAIREMEVVVVEPAAPHHARFGDRIPRIQYNGTRAEIRFPSTWLDDPMPLADPIVHREAIAQLESAKATMVSQDPIDRVRAWLSVPSHRFPSLDVVAQRLGLSSRTLRRQLQAQHARFQTLRDEARHARGATLLMSSMLTIDEIADALGYSRAIGFIRAFQRWSGMSPTEYRKRMQPGSR